MTSATSDKLDLSHVQHKMITEVAALIKNVADVDHCSNRRAFLSIAVDVYGVLYPTASEEDVWEIATAEWLVFRNRTGFKLSKEIYDRCIGILGGRDPLPVPVGEAEIYYNNLKGVKARSRTKK